MGEAKQNGAEATRNGQQVNGHKAPASAKLNSNKKIPPAPLAKTNKAEKPPSTLAKFMSLRRASQRPLPTERGDGSYRPVANRPTLRDDLGTISKAG